MESAARAVPRGTIYVGLQGAITYVVSFLSYAVLTRILRPVEIGQLPLFNAIQAVFTTITIFSLNVATAKFVSEFAGIGRKDRVWGVALVALKVVASLSIPGFLLFLMLSSQLSRLVFGTPLDAQLVSLVVTSGLIANFVTILASVLWGLNLFGPMVTVNLVGAILSRVFGIFLATTPLRLEGYLIGWILGNALGLVSALTYLRPHLKRSQENFSARTLIAYSYPLLFSSLVLLVQSWADVTILYALTGSLVYTGIYFLGSVGSNILNPIPNSLVNAVFPTLSSKYGRDERESFRAALRVAGRAVNVLVLPVSFGLIGISRTAVRVAYGISYLGAAIPFAILIAAAIITSYSTLMSLVLQATARTQPIIKIAIAAALTEITFTAALTAPLNVAGPAVARFGMFVVTLLLTYRYVRGEWWPSIDRTQLTKCLVLSLVIAVVLFGFDSFILSGFMLGSATKLLLDAGLFLTIYLGGLWLFKPLHSEDMDLLRTAFPSSLQRMLNILQYRIVKD